MTILNPDCEIGKWKASYTPTELMALNELRGYKGSTAEAYALEYNIPFVTLDADVPTTAITTTDIPQMTTTAASMVSTTTTSSAASNVIRIKAGETTAVAIPGIPEGAAVVWASSDSKIAVVEDGTLKAVSSGETTVYAIYNGSVYATYTVRILSDKYSVGDVNNDGIVDASDASDILSVYAALSTGEEVGLTMEELMLADVNNDGMTDATDSSDVLNYYAFVSTGGDIKPEEYFVQT